MKHGTYAHKLADGRYEFGILIEKSRRLRVYYGVLGTYTEHEMLPPKREPYGVANDYQTACKCMAAIAS